MKIPKAICQSCAVPILREYDKGIENTGVYSEAYCRRCYQSGTFTDPNMTVAEMHRHIRTKMVEMRFPSFLARLLADKVYSLKRRKDPHAAPHN